LKYIAINPYITWNTGRWPLRKYSSLIKKLLSYNEYFVIIIIRGLEEIRYNWKLYEPFAKTPRVINLTGKINLYELTALMDIIDLLITSDSGPMHIAIAQKTKVLSLWGPTNPKKRLLYRYIGKKYFYI